MKNLLSSWKTNLCALAVLVLVVLYNLNVISSEQLTTSVPVIVALGLALSKDNSNEVV
jgi:hypothetical protein